MKRRPPRSTRTDTPCPVTTLFRSTGQPSASERLDAVAAELDDRESELEARKFWGEPDSAQAESLAKLRLAGWGFCLGDAERRLSRSTEAVETIATAIFGSCVLKEQSYRQALVLSYRGRTSASKRENLAEAVFGQLL